MRETGTGQQVAQLHERLMMMMTRVSLRQNAPVVSFVSLLLLLYVIPFEFLLHVSALLSNNRKNLGKKERCITLVCFITKKSSYCK